MSVYVMLGAPGAGKGTQADELADRLGLPHLASGDLFRNALRDGTPLGLEAKRFMDRGALVPDKVTIRMIDERMAQPDASGGAILDGFPRTRRQAVALDAYLAARGSRVDRALYVHVPKPELLRRLSGRLLCEAAGHTYHETSKPPKMPGVCDIDGSALYCRQDDNVETVRARLTQQLAPLRQVIGYYRGRGALLTVDGERPIGEVTDALLDALAQPPAA